VRRSEPAGRTAARAPGPAYVLARAAGVDRSVLSRFVNGKRAITLALAGHEGLETTRRYVGPGRDDLAAAVDRLAGGEG